jgi:DNA-binding response OmpR family regulator
VFEANASGSGALRILVADDNEDAASSLAVLLELSGHTVQIATDGEQAVHLAQSMRPGVALLDLGMPKINGANVARAIRAANWGQSMLLVAITGWSVTEAEKRGARTAFDAYLVKPVDFDALLLLLQAMKPSG